MGTTRSCGCLLRDTIVRHGGYRSALYKIWHAMLDRCRNPAHQEFRNYGGRGITVCQRWLDFANFRADMAPRSRGGMLDRVDVNGIYEPGNCRWATALEQANNRRNNRRLTHNGETLTVATWARRLHVSKNCILYRLQAGWTVARTCTTPANRSASNVESRRLRSIE